MFWPITLLLLRVLADRPELGGINPAPFPIFLGERERSTGLPPLPRSVVGQAGGKAPGARALFFFALRDRVFCMLLTAR